MFPLRALSVILAITEQLQMTDLNYPGPVTFDKHTCTQCGASIDLIVGFGQAFTPEHYHHCPNDEGKMTGMVLGVYSPAKS